MLPKWSKILRLILRIKPVKWTKREKWCNFLSAIQVLRYVHECPNYRCKNDRMKRTINLSPKK